MQMSDQMTPQARVLCEQIHELDDRDLTRVVGCVLGAMMARGGTIAEIGQAMTTRCLDLLEP